ncbi:MAG: AraC family transcriptional regulator [Propionibacteriaceae bacterium]
MPARQSLTDATSHARRLVGKPAARELVPVESGTSARWHMHDFPGPYCRWNYHPEYEIHLIQHGTGRAIVGDHIGQFTAGQLVLVGSNLPHHWISDLPEGEVIRNRDVVFQFHPQWFTDCQQLMPELQAVEPLLHRSRRGIEFTGPTASSAATELLAIGDATGVSRLQHILSLLQTLAEAPAADAQLLASLWTPPSHDSGTADIVDTVLGYVFAHAGGAIRMADVAAQVGMSESAFSRYFSRATGQNFSDTVRKLRLAHACHLLEHTDEPIATVCHRTGYQNLSNFNRQFLREHGATPGGYRRRSRESRRG